MDGVPSWADPRSGFTEEGDLSDHPFSPEDQQYEYIPSINVKGLHPRVQGRPGGARLKTPEESINWTR